MAAPKNDKNLQPIEEIRGMTLLLEMEYADESIRSQGTGFFVAHDKIATNCHVLLGATKVIAKHIEADTTYTIEGIIAFDTENDLVVLKTADKGTSFQLGDSDMVKSGEPICVLGYPKEEECRSDGTLIGFLNRGKRIRFKAPIGPGYSGGPVLNGKREVIAVIQGGKNKSGDDGIAISSNTLKALLAEAGNVEVEPLSTWQKRLNVLMLTVYNLYECGRWYKRTLSILRCAWHVVKGTFYGIRASIKHTSGNYQSAIAVYDKIIVSKLIPFLKTAYAARGMAKSGLGNYQDGIEDANEAIFLDPDSGTGYFSRGHVNLMYAKYKTDQGKLKKSRSRFQDAISDLTEAINLNPETAKSYNLRGWTKYLLGQVETQKGNRKKSKKLFQAAISDADEALQLELKNAKYRSAFYHTRGAAKAGLGDHNGAIEDFNESIRLRPKKVLYYHDRGLSKEAFGQQEAAEVDFAKAKELDPDSKDKS
ncbi:MAG: tetratricopeptide repeat-containing serine protease family protein [Candidatus Poribacteria bacterium]|nr:tetratricopeptide repeat-containing serine protease family protein [Candidatus Poribacteria bacterium]